MHCFQDTESECLLRVVGLRGISSSALGEAVL